MIYRSSTPSAMRSSRTNLGLQSHTLLYPDPGMTKRVIFVNQTDKHMFTTHYHKISTLHWEWVSVYINVQFSSKIF